MVDEADRENRWAEMMIAAQNGDSVVYGDLLQDLSTALRGYFRRRLAVAAEIEDLVQETLMSLHRGRHTYIPGRPFGAWMYSIARNRMVDSIRSNKRRGSDHAQVEDFVDYLAAPEEMADAARLREALEILPEKQRTIFGMIQIQGLPIRTVAAQLGLSESDVKVTAHRAQKTLRAKLLATE